MASRDGSLVWQSDDMAALLVRYCQNPGKRSTDEFSAIRRLILAHETNYATRMCVFYEGM